MVSHQIHPRAEQGFQAFGQRDEALAHRGWAITVPNVNNQVYIAVTWPEQRCQRRPEDLQAVNR